MRLLVCISYHHTPERLKYLMEVLDNIKRNYPEQTDIIIDTNSSEDIPELSWYNVLRFSHPQLIHPFHLTCWHKIHIKRNIDNYDYFMYIEDDILLPWEAFKNYIENFPLLWAKNYVPSFVRIEEANGNQYVSDVVKKQTLNIIEIGGKQFTHLNFPNDYHGFWIMPQKELKESMTTDFTKLSDNRESNAMFAGWGLGKTTLVQIENGLVSPLCYSYHLPSNYALSKDSIQARFKPTEIFL